MSEDWLTVDATRPLVQQVSSTDLDIMTKQKLSKDLEVLTETFDEKLSTLTQTSESNSENFDVKINTVNKNLVNVKNEIEGLKKSGHGQKKYGMPNSNV